MTTHTATVWARVLERRRAVALARHYREAEGLSIAQIADRLGRSPATVKAYFYDPTGEKARAVKARYSACAAAAARTRSRATARATPTPTARRAIPARSSGAGPASAWSTRCLTGAADTAGCRRPTTGRARTRAVAVVRRSNDWRPPLALGERRHEDSWELGRGARRGCGGRRRCYGTR